MNPSINGPVRPMGDDGLGEIREGINQFVHTVHEFAYTELGFYQRFIDAHPRLKSFLETFELKQKDLPVIYSTAAEALSEPA